MPKPGRLSRNDFAHFSRASRRIHGSLFSLAIHELSPSSRGPKFACVVSKKVSSKASERNRIKRRCRECARTILKDVSFPRAFVFTAKRASRDESFESIEREITELLKEAVRAAR